MTNRYPGGLVRRTAANTSITGASGVWDLGSQAQAVKTNTWPISGLANPVSGSLRFRSSASAYLNRTFGTPTLSTKWTWSGWIKFGDASTYYTIFDGGSPDTRFGRYPDTNQLYVNNDSTNFLITTPVYRDYSAWYHAVLAFDSSQGTASNRLRLYINGSEVTAFATDNRSSISGAIGINTATAHGIGRQPSGGSAYFDGYLAEVNFIDGQQLTPSSFGQTSPITGVWEPIKYTGTYGTNGFYLSLSDTSSIGKDFSGNGNNWTPNNISTASGSTFDLMRDVPTQYTPQGVTDVGGTVRGNYATLNPLAMYGTNATISDGSLTSGATSTSNDRGWPSTIAAPGSGKWYAEFTFTATNGDNNGGCGIMLENGTGAPGESATTVSWRDFGTLRQNASGTTYGSALTTNDVVMVAYDAALGRVWFGKNGTWFASGDPATNANPSATGITTTGRFATYHYNFVATIRANFGQRPFAYTPPSGFNSLCTTNLPTPTIGATTATAANKYFDATLYTGNGSTNTITNAGGFQPDFIWEKARSDAFSHMLYNSISGVGKYLRTNLTSAEVTDATTLTSFNSNGFTVGAGDNGNNSGSTSVAWQWNAGGSTVTNTTGTISAQVRVNPTAGFSIVTYTGNATSSQTVGHGLGTTPTFFILKSRGIQVWNVYSLAGGIIGNTILQLNTTDAAVTGGNISLTASPTTIGFGSASQVNGSGVGFVAYVFAPVAGYSAFGSYTGNGSTDGPFVFTGFRPRFLLIKNSSTSVDWVIEDTSRDPYNVVGAELFPNLSNAESSGNADLDILSNGFKIRRNSTFANGSGNTIIYAAFAETPFKNSLAR